MTSRRFALAVLYASALVLAFVGGEWRGRRVGDDHRRALHEESESFRMQLRDCQGLPSTGTAVPTSSGDFWIGTSGGNVTWPDPHALDGWPAGGDILQEAPEENGPWLCRHSAVYRKHHACPRECGARQPKPLGIGEVQENVLKWLPDGRP